MRRVDSLEKTDAGRDWGQEEKGTTEDEMAGWTTNHVLSLLWLESEDYSGVSEEGRREDDKDVIRRTYKNMCKMPRMVPDAY